jgi:phosphatidylglycerol:prolipoprotein diacylglycerol transferase
MRPILLKIGSLSIGSYGAMVALAFLVATYVWYQRAKKESISSKIIIEFALILLISGLIGARLFHTLQHIKSNGFIFRNGGLTYYGGFVSASIAGFIYLRSKELPISKMMDIITPSLAIGEAIGRIGCFLAGCCFGKPTDSVLCVTYPEKSLTYTLLKGQCSYPTQVFTSIILFLVFIILIIISKWTIFSGQLFLIYAIIHSIQRFFIDFFRLYSPEEYIGNLATSQLISLIIGFSALFTMIIILFRRHRYIK